MAGFFFKDGDLLLSRWWPFPFQMATLFFQDGGLPSELISRFFFCLITNHLHLLYLRPVFFVSSTRGPNVIGLHVNAFTFFSQPTSQKQLETVIYVEMYILRGFFALLSGCQEDKLEQLYLIIITLGPPVVLLSFYKK